MKVKICGITNEPDAAAAIEAGADLLGFVFYPISKRYVPARRARVLVRFAHSISPTVMTVGVFVNETPERVRATMEECALEFAQLHGEETPEMMQALSPWVYKGLRPRDELDARALIETYRPAVAYNRPAFIVDSFSDKLYGGTGERADWGLACEIARAFPILLAGGLRPENVGQAVETVRPWGVDVSSGVERSPGVKDGARVRAFVSAAKAAARNAAGRMQALEVQ